MEILKKILIPQVYLPIIYIIIGFIVYYISKKVLTTIFNKQKKINIGSRNAKRYNTVFQVVLDCIKLLV